MCAVSRNTRSETSICYVSFVLIPSLLPREREMYEVVISDRALMNLVHFQTTLANDWLLSGRTAIETIYASSQGKFTLRYVICYREAEESPNSLRNLSKVFRY